MAVKHSTPRAVEHIPGPTIQDQTTASKMLDKTMTLLSDDEVRRISIWGMGGVGKTTLVRNLNNQLEYFFKATFWHHHMGYYFPENGHEKSPDKNS